MPPRTGRLPIRVAIGAGTVNSVKYPSLTRCRAPGPGSVPGGRLPAT
jgi:hypothetical protein